METIQSNTKKDCLGCRITGSLTGIGVGGYLAYHARLHRSALMLSLAGVSMLAGLYRGLVWKQ